MGDYEPVGTEEARLNALGIQDISPPKPAKPYRIAPKQKCSPCGIARIFGSLMVGMVFALVALSYVPFMYHFGDGTFGGGILIFIFHILLGLMLTSYIQVSFTDPGTPTMEWNDAVSRMKNPPYPMCRKSGLYKPPRSHYDSVTRRLVLNMDHYCPWVNNCVGFFNRKFFIQFVSYTALTCLYVSLSFGIMFYFQDESNSKNSSATPIRGLKGVIAPVIATRKKSQLSMFDSSKDGPTIAIMTLMAAIIDGVFSLSLSIFAIAHIWMACKNMTTIEGARSSRPFCLTTTKNLESVFGVNKLYWFLPLYGKGPSGDGMHWQLQDGSWTGITFEPDEEEQQIENSQQIEIEIDSEIKKENHAHLHQPEEGKGVELAIRRK